MASDPGTVSGVLSGAMAGAISGNNGLGEEIARLADELQQLQTSSQSATESKQAGSQTTSGGASSGSIGSALLDVFGTGLGLSPLISGIVSLLSRGGDSSTPAPLTRFTLPPS